MKNNNKRIFFYLLLFLAFIIEIGLIISLIKGYSSRLSFLIITLSNLLVIVVAILNIRRLKKSDKFHDNV